MHIVYIDPHPVPDSCPEAMQILQTVDGLAQIGVDVLLATPAPAAGADCAQILGRPAHPRVKFRYLADPRGRWWFPSRSGRPFYRTACRFAAELGEADGLLVRNLKLAEALLGVATRPPMVFETHEVFARTFAEDHAQPNWSQSRKLAALRAREGSVYAGCAGLAALTDWLVEDLRAEYGVATPAAVVPDGVDMNAAANVKRKPRWSDPPELLYLGSLHPWKGVDRLVTALATIPAARLVIGGGPEERIAELAQLAARVGVAQRVRFLGMVPPDRRFQVIADADLCLLPLTDTSIGSRYTSPLKLFEYMAVGKPVVAADVPAIRSVITHGVDGVLAPVDDPAGLAAAVQGLLADPVRADALGRAARLRAENFSWRARAARLTDLFASLRSAPCAA